ncbi:MAG: MATE family efflux transporter [Oscillospiraceae bacterium]|nr:MATE family efflux transporter [Oscillospiraceae bacterium]
MTKLPEGPPGENRMGSMPENRLLLKVSAPMAFSMLLQALYNIVDGIFVSQICENAFTAVSLAFPVQFLLIAMGVGTGVGVNAMLSKCLGEKDFDGANRAAKNAIFLAVCYSVLFLIIGLTLSQIYFDIQTDDQEIRLFGRQYMSIICCFSFGAYGQIVFEKLLQSTSRTVQSMIIQAIGCILNLILDPILIFGWLFFPKMGVVGAAVATVSGQIIGAVCGYFINRKYNSELDCSMIGFRPHAPTIKRIYKVGIPAILQQAVGSFLNFGMNQILLTFTPTASAVFGAYFKLQSFIFMPVIGLNNGMVPILAYNYGAGKRKRVMKTMQLAIVYACVIMLIGLSLFHTIPGLLLGMFDASPTMLRIGCHALRVISLSFLFAGFCIVCCSVYQAMGYAHYALIQSCCRQLVVLLPAAWLLSFKGLDAVWWSFPIAEIASVIMSVLFLMRVYNKVIKHIPNNP